MLRILTAFLALALCACSNPDQKAARLTQEGLKEMEARSYRSAVVKFDAALAANPGEDLRGRLHFFRGSAHNRIGNFELALKDLEPYRGKMVVPNLKGSTIDVLMEIAQAHLHMGLYKEAMKDLDEALAVDPDSGKVLNSYAWLLCTSPDESIIDAPRALEMATKAVGRIGLERIPPTAIPAFRDTLAAAYAANGDFKKATEIQASLLDQVDNTLKREFQSRLELYQAGKAYREEPPGN